jgi:hypothetical protein
MPDVETAPAETLNDAVFHLGVALARLSPGPLARLRRAKPSEDIADFWKIYFQQGLDRQPGTSAADWEWVVAALALLTPTGNDPDKRSAHERIPLGKALFDARVSDLRVAKVLNAPFQERRKALMRLVRMLARADARLDTRELARLLLFSAAEKDLRNLAKSYYAAEAAATKEDPNA